MSDKRSKKTRIMSPKEAARYLNIHLITIFRLMKKGEIPAITFVGRRRFKKEDLDKWKKERRKP